VFARKSTGFLSACSASGFAGFCQHATCLACLPGTIRWEPILRRADGHRRPLLGWRSRRPPSLVVWGLVGFLWATVSRGRSWPG